MPNSVLAYTTSWCPDCLRSKRLMQRMGVRYREIDVEQVRGAEDEMRARNGGSGKVPTIVIDESTILVEPTDADLRRALQNT